MKFLLLALVLFFVYLFCPTYDLYVKESPFAENYVFEKSGFYSKSACAEYARGLTDSAREMPAHRCRKTSKWGRMYSSYTQYDPAIREALRRQQ